VEEGAEVEAEETSMPVTLAYSKTGRKLRRVRGGIEREQ
jgi:hypothetical protein